MKLKIIGVILIGLLVLGVVMISGCIEEKTEEETTEPTPAPEIETYECGAGTIEIYGQCVISYVPDINCTPTPNPSEVCDGVDNDCDGTIDNGCTGGIGADDLSFTAYACRDYWFNGGRTVIGNESNMFILGFSGSQSNPGSLHKLTSTGTFVLDVTSVPYGGIGLSRAHDSRIYAQGGDWSTTKVIEVDAFTGVTIRTVFEGSPGYYSRLLAVDSNGRAYLKGGSSSYNNIYRTSGTDTISYTEVLNSLPFKPNYMGFTPYESHAYVTSYNKIGLVDILTEGYVELDTINGSIGSAVVDDNGYLYVNLVKTDPPWIDPFECQSGFATCNYTLWRYSQDGTKQRLFNLNHSVRFLILDPL